MCLVPLITMLVVLLINQKDYELRLNTGGFFAACTTTVSAVASTAATTTVATLAMVNLYYYSLLCIALSPHIGIPIASVATVDKSASIRSPSLGLP